MLLVNGSACVVTQYVLAVLPHPDLFAMQVCVRKDTKQEFQWRIRNLPYGLDMYVPRN